MKKNITALSVFALLLAPVVCNASEVRILPYVNDLDIATEHEAADTRYAICDKCPRYAALALKPVAPIGIKVPEEEKKPVPGTAAEEDVADVALQKEETQAGVASVGKDIRCKVGEIHFGFDEHKATRQEYSILRSLANKLKDENHKVVVSGYTDKIGTKEYNDGLAKRRAKTVASYLEKHGVTVSLLEGTGKCCYVSAKNKPNRRVEVNLLKKEGEKCNE